MKLQSMAVIFVIIVIPMTLILSAYIGFQIDTIALQQEYDTKLLDATHDSVVAFQLNTVQNKYSTNADSLRRDITASVNSFFTSLTTNLRVPGEQSAYVTQYVPAMVFTLYDGYYIYSPIEKEYEDKDSSKKTKYEHALKPYIYYSQRYKYDTNDIVVNYSLDNYITIYGFINNTYVSKSGYLIAGTYNNNTYKIGDTSYSITDETAKTYYDEADEFTKWIKNNIAGMITPKNAVDENGDAIPQFQDSAPILNVSDSNDPENPESAFTAHKREVMKNSIQSNLNNAIKSYSEHTTLNVDFRMPIMTEQDWDKILSNVNIITFMQGLPVGFKEYNNYAIVTSTKNKQYVDPDLLYFTVNGDDTYYHKINCPTFDSSTTITRGYRSIDFEKVKNEYKETQEDGTTEVKTEYVCLINAKEKDKNGKYKITDGDIENKLACYTCIINSEVGEVNNSALGQYYNTLARERYNLNKLKVTLGE